MGALELLLASGLIAQTADSRLELQVQKLFVPKDQVSTVLPQVIAPQDPMIALKLSELDRRLDRYGRAANARAPRGAVACSLSARWDPIRGSLFGEGTWYVPKGPAPVVVLEPWGLSVAKFLEPAPASAGLDATGRLQLRTSQPDQTVVALQWELQPTSRRGGDTFEFAVPPCALATLDVVLPDGYQVRLIPEAASGGRPVRRLELRPNTQRLLFGGQSDFAFQIQSAAEADRSSTLTVKTDADVHFDETGILVDAKLLLDSFRQPVRRVELLLDHRIEPVQSNAREQWTQTYRGDGTSRWIGEFRRARLGSFDVTLRGVYPLPPDRRWRLPLIYVDGALSRGNRVDFAIADNFEILDFNPGHYRQTFGGNDQDGRYHILLDSPRPARTDAQAWFLEAGDFKDPAGFWRAVVRGWDRESSGVSKALARVFPQAIKLAIRSEAQSETVGEQTLGGWRTALNSALQRADFYLPADFEDAADGVTLRALLRRDAESLSRIEIVQRNRLLLQEDKPRFFSPPPATASAPTLTLGERRPEVETTINNELQLFSPKAQLVSTVEWTCKRGSLYQPQVQISPGWEVLRVVEISGLTGERPLNYRLEPDDDGATRCRIRLAAALTERQTLQARIFAQPQQPVTASPEGFELKLPDVRTIGLPVSRPATYQVVVDHDFPAVIEEWPFGQTQGWSTSDQDGQRFQIEYVPPAPRDPILLRGRPPRYVADVQQRALWTGNGWMLSYDFSVEVDRGPLQRLRFRSTHPLPESTRWQWGDRGPSSLQPRRVSSGDGPSVYEMTVDAPSRQELAFRAEAYIQDRSVRVPVIVFSEALRSNAAVAVLTGTGEHVRVDESPGMDPGVCSSSEDGLPVWCGRLTTKDAPTSLVVTAALGDEEVITHVNQAAIFLRSWLSHDRVRCVTAMDAQLQCRQNEELTVRLPGDAHLWRVALDGREVIPWTADGSMTIPGELERGRHHLEVVYSHELASKWKMIDARIPAPLPGWDAPSTTWNLYFTEPCAVLAGRDLKSRNLTAASTRVQSPPTPGVDELERDLQPVKQVSSFRATWSTTGKDLTVTVIPEEWLVRVSRLVALALAAFGGFACVQISAAASRWLVMLTALATAAAALASRDAHWLLVFPFGVALGVMCLTLLLRTRFQAVAAVLLLTATPLEAQEPTPNHKAAQFSVVVSLDSSDTEPKAYVPLKLWDLLAEPLPPNNLPVVVEHVSLRGSVTDEMQIDWTANLKMSADPSSQFPLPVQLRFSEVDVESLAVRGETITNFERPGKDLPLGFDLPGGGESSVSVTFRTPLLRQSSRCEFDFGVPPALATDFELRLRGDVALVGNARNVTIAREQEGTVLSGRLAPTGRFRLRWRELNTAADAVQTARCAHLINVGEKSVDLLAAVRFENRTGVLDRLEIALGPALVLRRVEAGDFVEDYWIETGSQGRRLIVLLKNPRSGHIDVIFRGMLPFPPDHNVRLPRIEPLHVHSETGYVAVQVPDDWTVAEAPLRNAEPVPEEEFLRFWNELSQTPPRRLAITKKYRQRPFKYGVVVKPPETDISVEQDIELTIDPISRSANIVNRIQLIPGSRPVYLVKLQVPPAADFVLERIVSDGELYQWYRRGNIIELLPTSPINSPWDVVVTGRFSSSGARQQGNAALGFRIQSFQWPQSENVETNWRLQPPENWVLQIPSTRSAREVVNPQSIDRRVVSSAQQHSFRVTARRTSLQTRARNLIVVVANGESLSVRGMVHLTGVPRRRTRFRFRAPKHFENVEWESNEQVTVSDVVRSEARYWDVEVNRSPGDVVQFRWKLSSASMPFVVMDVTPMGAQVDSSYVCYRSMPGVAWDVRAAGMTETDPPREVLGRAASLGEQDISNGTWFEATDDSWTLRCTQHKSTPNQEYESTAGRHRVLLSASGRMRGVSQWYVLDHRPARLRLRHPGGVVLEELDVNGAQIRKPARTGDVVFVPLPNRQRWQRFTAAWSLHKPGDTVELLLPTLQGDSEPALVEILDASQGVWKLEGSSTPPAEWIGAGVQQLSRVLEHPGEQSVDSLTLDSMNAEFSELRRQAEQIPESDGARVSLRRLNATLQQQSETQRSGQSRSDIGLMDDVRASQTLYVRWDQSEPIRLHRREQWHGGATLSAAQWVSMFTGLVVAFLAVFPSLWPGLQLYWPALAFPLGVAWTRWTPLQPVGVMMMLVAFAGTWWMMREWFVSAPAPHNGSTFAQAPTKIVQQGGSATGSGDDANGR